MKKMLIITLIFSGCSKQKNERTMNDTLLDAWTAGYIQGGNAALEAAQGGGSTQFKLRFTSDSIVFTNGIK